MNKLSSEERYPLLLLYVEENGKKSEFPRRVVFAEKNRGKEVIQGAATIIKQWPGQATSCWLTSIALASTFLLLVFIVLISSLNPLYHSSHLRCVRDSNSDGNKTIHLIKHGNQWTKHQLEILKFTAQKFPDFKIHTLVLDTTMRSLLKPTVNTLMVEEEIPSTSQAPISLPTTERNHLFILPDLTSIFFRKFNDILSNKKEEVITTTEQMTTPSIEEIERKEGIIKIEDNVATITKMDEPKKSLEATNNSIPLRRTKRCLFRAYRKTTVSSYNDILSAFPNIHEDKMTYNRYFDHTPLKYYWMDYNPEILNFAVRIQELWQNGGISFHLPLNSDPKKVDSRLTSNAIVPKTSTTTDNLFGLQDKTDLLRLKILIANTKFRYYRLAEDVVSIDEEGMHMAARIPCHAFFGEMLIKLQKEDNVSIPVFIAKMLSVFCKRGAVDPEYCKTI